MRTAVRYVEDQLARIWPWLFMGVLLLTLACGCAASRIVTDPVTGEETVVTVGTDLIPGGSAVVEGVTGSPSADIVGSVADAVSSTDVPTVVKDVNDGNWIEVVLAVLGFGAAVYTGVKKRKKIREVLTGKKVT